jgi:hypothetical protein
MKKIEFISIYGLAAYQRLVEIDNFLKEEIGHSVSELDDTTLFKLLGIAK